MATIVLLVPHRGLLSSQLAQGCAPRVVVFVLIELGCTELGVAWRAADLGALPPLFTVRSQHARAGDLARDRMVTLGLIDPRGVVRGDLHQAMAAFALSPVEADLRFAVGRGVGRVG